jgi:hypothetical protein
VKVPYQLSGVL